ncbi:assimilatory nitrate reductase (NADH) beta subunit [Vreelandella songnenensis]|uniref:Assimilatory nitrate reductase (NADH) beta subunit n=1 Tax=Vreelandella songnenensis TaxID=1176243 RepID=A0A2T0V530_9GAMM|nr:FAD-dependent oxidoreductase [Halomonas songnenensis]PRY65299.1 assimilatory nitrate reductase (NADH) beta subunit [Halomonas songnenensis]
METTSRCSPQDHLVIIGNGMASHRLLEQVVEAPNRPARISVIGAEASPAYNRILLSPLLSGELQPDALSLRSASWYAERGITLHLGERVTHIDRGLQRVVTSQRTLAFDQLVIATGSRPALPDVPGMALEGVHGFRTLEDADTLADIATRGGQCVVIGGGLLGLEAAEGLRKRGADVYVIQRGTQLMNRQLDDTAARLLEATLAKRGLTIHTQAQLSHLEDDGHGHVAAVVLTDGRRLPAQSVVVAAGITPNAELGAEAGLETRRAILVDNTLATSDPRIHALGECCQFEQHTYGLVEPIWRQVEVLADALCGKGRARYREAPTATKLKISGIALYAFGPTEASAEHEVLSYHDPESGDYRRLLLRNGRLEGAVLYGDTRTGPWYFAKALAGTDLTACRQALLFGEADANALLDPDNAPSPSTTLEAA